VAIKEIYNAIKPESIDYALMEKVKEAKMFKAGFRWSDVGAWSSVYELNSKDELGNVAMTTNNIFIDSEGSMIFSTGDKPIAVIGLKNIAIIETENGILISPLDQVQKVKDIPKKLK
jgi:mannose-1-phosphate guanylyltransferase